MPVDPEEASAPENEEETRPGFASGSGTASVRAPRAGQGPKRPPSRSGRFRPDPTGTANGSGHGTASDGAQPVAPMVVLDPDDTAVGPAPVLEPEVVPVAAVATPGAAPAAPSRPRRQVRRGRRVKRVVRRIDLWSVLKLSLVVYTCLYLATLATLAVLWRILYSSGTIEKLQSFLQDVGLENFTFYGNQMFRACAAIGAIGVMAGTVITVLATALVNVISELTGGIRLVVIEEDVQQ